MTEDKDNASSVEDLKNVRSWTLGILGFATTVSAVLVQAFHFRLEPTLVAVAGFAFTMIATVLFINRAETRQNKALGKHIDYSTEVNESFLARLDSIDDVLLDIQKSTLRTEICNEIRNNPKNHETIIRMGERYFCQLKGDWVMTDLYQAWVDSEQEAGRRVHLPPELLMTVTNQILTEKDK